MTFRVAQVSGSSGATIERGLVQHPGSVVIVPVTDDGRIVMIRNHRWTVDKTLLELPAGTLTAGEDPLLAAGRELREETGYEAAKLQPLMAFYAAPGSSTERMWCYVATGLKQVGQQLEDDEQITVELVALADVPGLLRDGDIEDAKSIASLARWLLDSR